jgi:hypothetical protein
MLDWVPYDPEHPEPQAAMSTIPASAINPSAGSYPVTFDPRELEAARRAGNASVAEFPYYLERFGERGRMFGASDGAWLVSLCEFGTEYVRGQVLWLGSVLASRGMPRWLLERHLHVLHAELVRALPEHAERYAVLLDAAAHLGDLRRARIADEDFRELSRRFAARADPAVAERLPGMGAILAAAVADEADGVAGAVQSVEAWAADRSAFPEGWTSAVRATLAEARGRVRAG